MDPRPIGDALGAFLKHSDVVKRGRATRRWAEVWSDVAGADLVLQTEVRGVRNGVLTIAVASPPLLHELASFRRADLLRAMNDRVPGAPLKDIHFRHASL